MDKPLSRAIKKVQKNKKVDEAIVTGTLAALGKGALIAGKALAKGAAVIGKAGAKGAKVAAKTGSKVANTTAKSVKKTTSTADRMAAAYNKNKSLISKKQGLPSNKISNSGKNTVDPKKNTVPVEPLNDTPEKKNTTSNNTSQNTDKDEKKKKPTLLTKTKKIVKKTGKDIASNTGKKVGKAAKDTVKDTSTGLMSAYGKTSFKKESITFKDFLNKL